MHTFTYETAYERHARRAQRRFTWLVAAVAFAAGANAVLWSLILSGLI